MPSFTPATGLLAALDLLQVSHRGAVAHVRLNRPAKRNAISDALVPQLHTCFVNLPEAARAVVSAARASTSAPGSTCRSCRSAASPGRAAFAHVACGVRRRSSSAACRWSRCCTARWSAAGSSSPAACHIRVAEARAFYGLPEGQRGIFVGGGGSARMPRLIGVARMTDMMLTGRVYDAEEGLPVGLSQYLVPEGEGLAKALELAERIAGNAPLSNFAVMHALPRIADLSQSDGLFIESLMAAIAQGTTRPRSGCAPSSKGAPARWRSRERDAPTPAPSTAPQYRAAARVGGCVCRRRVERRADGSVVLRSTEPLGAVSGAPDRPPRALGRESRPTAPSSPRRDAGGDWQRISYAQMLRARAAHRPGAARPRAVGRAAGRDPVRQRPRAPAAGARRACGPACRSCRSRRPTRCCRRTHGKLRHILGTLTPGLVFASDGRRTARRSPPPCRPMSTGRAGARRRRRPRGAPLRRPARHAAPGAAVDAAHAAGRPRHDRQVPVHLGLDQAAQGRDQHAAHAVRQPADDAPVLARSWPRSRRCWSTGCRGTTPSAATTTSASRSTTAARSTSTTASRRRRASARRCATCARSRRRSTSTCPRASRRSRARWSTTRCCAARCFARVQGLHVRRRRARRRRCGTSSTRTAEAAIGERIRMITGLGMTETAPSCTFAVGTDVRSRATSACRCRASRSSWCRLDGKTEIRFRGPNVMPGYWRAPEQTREAFDDEGFYRTGDAVRWIDAADPQRGLLFDGRIAEDFKLVHRHLRQRRPAAREGSSRRATPACRTW